MGKYAAAYEHPRPFIKRVTGPLVVVLAMFYLGFHAISGERGLIALFTDSRRLDALTFELAEVTQQRQALEHKVHRLSDNSLDLDLLDEQVRRVLGMTGRSEVVYFLNDQQAGKQ